MTQSQKNLLNNPLIELDSILDYQAIKPAMIQEAIDYWIEACKKEVKIIHQLKSKEITWQSAQMNLLNQFNALNKAFSVASHFHMVCDSPEIRKVFEYSMIEVQKFSNELDQDKKVYEKLLQLRKKTKNLSKPQIRYLDLEIRKYQKEGIHLEDKNQELIKSINQKLAKLSLKFEQNVQDSANQFTHFVFDENQLDGLPENLIQGFKKEAEKTGKKGYLIHLSQPIFISVMQSAENRNLRLKLHQAWQTRATQGQFNNEAIINEIFELRNQKARILGFIDYCDYILSERMAKNYQVVQDLLHQIGNKACKKAKTEIEELSQFAKEKLNLEKLQAHDIAFVSQKLKEMAFGFNDETLRNFFPVSKVLEGLFEIIENLYGIQLKEVNLKTWNPKVRSFEILHQGRIAGILYADLYARSSKRAGAWMSDYQSFLEEKYHNQNQIPVAFINMNFMEHQNESYLSFEDILTLFHETGHSLHHLLTQIGLMPISGINAVEWDAVELPSQLMENFCYNYHYLRKMSTHKQTGEPIDLNLFNQIIAAKNQFSGLFLMRQLILALFDLNAHHQNNYHNWQALLSDIRNQWLVSPIADYESPIHSFSHIFAGGYASGYYSYLWADILSSDIYGYFIENGKLELPDEVKNINQNHFIKTANPKNGQDFLKHILSQGALQDASELFKNLRGRDPELSYLFQSYGIA